MELAGDLEVALVAEVERMALHAWPAWEVEEADGWLLRYAAGVTRRANSVWPNELQNERDLEARMAQVEKFYHERDLPSRFHLCPAAQPPHLDEFLAQRGYRSVAHTAVQTTAMADLVPRMTGNPELAVVITEKPTATWWQCYTAADGAGAESTAARMKICDAIQVATAYALVLRDGEPIAVGSASCEDGWIGFFNVATLRHQRRQGAARTLMAALVKWGLEQNASMAYLQVMAENHAAQKLYGLLGFKTAYFYHYREEILSKVEDMRV